MKKKEGLWVGHKPEKINKTKMLAPPSGKGITYAVGGKGNH